MAEVKPGKGFAAVTPLSAVMVEPAGVVPTADYKSRPGTAVPTLASVRSSVPLSPAACMRELGEQGCRLLWTRTAGISALSVQVRAGYATFRSPATDTCRVTGMGPQEGGTGWVWRRG